MNPMPSGGRDRFGEDCHGAVDLRAAIATGKRRVKKFLRRYENDSIATGRIRVNLRLERRSWALRVDRNTYAYLNMYNTISRFIMSNVSYTDFRQHLAKYMEEV